MSWQSVLEQVLGISYDSLERDGVQWAIIGSVASVLHGCQIPPNDIDFLAVKPEGVYRFAELMSAYAPPKCEYPPGDDNWRSSGELPVTSGPDPYGFMWHFARWYVDSFKVEIAHIVAPRGYPTSSDGAGIWEAGPEIWPYLRNVPFADYQVPLVPLEIQLETNLKRGLKDRVEEIIAIFQRNGYDRALIQKSLSSEHLKTFETLSENSSRGVLTRKG